MSYNPYLFDKIYNDCIGIITNSSDRNIKKKKKVLDFSYNKVLGEDECEIQEFFAVAHELRTYEFLKRIGQNPVANDDDNPGVDFICKIGNIECVTFLEAKDEFSVKISQGAFNRHKAFEPRVSQAINSKKEKYNEYIKKDQIDRKRPNIICLNPGFCDYRINSDIFITACELVLYGMGNNTLYINRETGEEFYGRNYQNTITKPNGKTIAVDYFDNDDFKEIGGVLLMDNLVGEVYKNPILYINANASIQIDRRAIRRFLSFIKDGRLRYHYSCNGKTISPRQYRGI